MTPNSRSYLNRFLSPDDIVPDPYNPLDWDRYSYCRNNPIIFNDPTGHWPTWPVPPVPPPYPIVSWLTGNAENVYQLIALGIAHTDHANIVGEGLQSLKDDPAIQAAHDKIVEDIRDHPEYERNEPFVIKKEFGYETFQEGKPVLCPIDGQPWALRLLSSRAVPRPGKL